MSLFTRSRTTTAVPQDDAAGLNAGAHGQIANDPGVQRGPAERPVRSARRTVRGGPGTRAVGAVASGVISVARLVMLVAVLIAALIALAILLRDVDANAHNTIVKGIHDGANFFAGAFSGLVTFSGRPKRAITVDWGIALVAYLIVGALLAGIISHFGRNGLAWERRRRAGAVT